MDKNTKNFVKATFLQRVAAFLIDLLILLVVLVPIRLLLPGLQSFILWIIQFVIIGTYNTFFVIRTGSTIGKRLLKIEVVDANYEKAKIKTALLREFVGKFISQILFGVGYIFPLNDPKRRALHDRIAATYVVKVDANRNLIPTTEDVKVKIYEKIIFYVIFIPIVISIILGLFYGLIARPVKLTSISMLPTYKQGSYLLALDHFTPQRDDIVAYSVFIKGKKQTFVKRVVGLPGEKVGLAYNRIYINGETIRRENQKGHEITTTGGAFLKANTQRLIPKNSYFVLGDNRAASLDSRDMGFVPARNITGKILMCYWNCK